MSASLRVGNCSPICCGVVPCLYAVITVRSVTRVLLILMTPSTSTESGGLVGAITIVISLYSFLESIECYFIRFNCLSWPISLCIYFRTYILSRNRKVEKTQILFPAIAIRQWSLEH